MEKQFEIKTKPCVGCGFCCINSRCIASQRLYKSADICPALIWSDVDNRYYCNLMMIEGSVGFAYRQELYAGAGCCSGLNNWRNDVKNRTKIEKVNIENQIDPLFQKFLQQMGKNFISSVTIKMCLLGMKNDLLKNGINKIEADQITKMIFHNYESSQSSFMKDFMG